MQSGDTKISTLSLYASAATQNKRYCSKMLSETWEIETEGSSR